MKSRFLSLFFLLVPFFCSAQRFGFEEEDNLSALPFSFEIGGEIEAGPVLFVHDFRGAEKAQGFSIWSLLSASPNFRVSGKNAEGRVSLNLSYRAFEQLWEGDPGPYTPLILDELWLRGYFDRLNVEAGLIKLRWGRMYNPGPLDVVNPLDYSDLTNLTNQRAMKIARPMIHASFNAGDFSEIEAVFLPNFAGHLFAHNGRWIPGQYSNITSGFSRGILAYALQESPPAFAPLIQEKFSQVQAAFSDYPVEFPGTETLDYFQTGIRFNTAVGRADLGFQYFYGNVFTPSVSIGGVDDFLADLTGKVLFNPSYFGNRDLLSPHIEYSRYHQIGLDWSQVLAGFTLRAEFAANITNDISGDDGRVRNPFLAWSFGFDRDIIAGLNVNIQCDETVRLLDDKVTKNPALDCEGEDDITFTRLIMQLSKSFFRDRLECKFVAVWGIEERDCVLIPSVSWTANDTRIELSSGIFAGDSSGQLGQYWENSYIKLVLRYSF